MYTAYRVTTHLQILEKSGNCTVVREMENVRENYSQLLKTKITSKMFLRHHKRHSAGKIITINMITIKVVMIVKLLHPSTTNN